MRRSYLAAAALVLLLVTAGCSALSPGGGEVDRQALAANETYRWDTSADVTINVTGGAYHAVYRVDGRREIALSEFQRLSDTRPLDVEAVQFRYPNGTVVGASAMTVERNDSATVVTLPAEEGRFAYRVPKRGKEVHMATAVSGSYEVILPPNTDVKYPLIGRVMPGGYETATTDGRVHVRWDDVTDDRLVVRYYLVRDLWIFGGMILVGAVAAVVGLSYFWMQLRGIRERRQIVDVENREE
jgi:hypothetical protein